MDRHFDDELRGVKNRLIEMATLVEDSIRNALTALKNKDTDGADRIRETDHRIDKFEIEIEDMCIELIARHQPVGSDLRFLIGVIKMNNDLERMGDHAVNIADMVKYIKQGPPMKRITTIWSMADIVEEMLKDSVKSFIESDPVKAQQVCERDSTVDDMRNEVIRILLTYMIEEPNTINTSISYLLVAKNLERIADLSTNICEDVIYIAQARVIKHHAEEKEK